MAVGKPGNPPILGAPLHAEPGASMPDRPFSITRLLLATALLCLGANAHALVSAVTPLAFTPVEGAPFIGNVGTFIDDSGVGSSASVSLNWGDGSPATSVVTITASTTTTNLFIITVTSGNGHVYTHAGPVTFTLTVADPLPPSTPVSASETITVNPVTSTFNTTLSGTTTVPSGTVIAAFADYTTTDPASQFTATISWGDGTAADPATVITGPSPVNSGPPPFTTFQISNVNPHVYATLGVYSIVTTISDGTGGSVINTLTFTAAINTTVSVVTSPNPSSFGTPVTFLATITAADGSAVTGEVDFTIDGVTAIPPLTATVVTTSVVVGSTTFYTNTAAYGTNALTAGAAHSIVATYMGDPTHNASPPSPAASQTVNASNASLLTLATSQNPVLLTQIVTFSATVTSGNGSTPTGTVSFFDTDTLLSAVPVSAGGPSIGTAAYSTTLLTAGTHVIRATYDGGGVLSPAETYDSIDEVIVDLSASGSSGGGSSRCGHGLGVGILSLGLFALMMRSSGRRRAR
jgi:hypothetical protein